MSPQNNNKNSGASENIQNAAANNNSITGKPQGTNANVAHANNISAGTAAQNKGPIAPESAKSISPVNTSANAKGTQKAESASGTEKKVNGKAAKSMDWSQYSNPHNSEWYAAETKDESAAKAENASGAEQKPKGKTESAAKAESTGVSADKKQIKGEGAAKAQGKPKVSAQERAAIKQEEQFIKQSERIAKKAQQASEKSKKSPEFEKLTLEEQELQEQQKNLRKMRHMRRRRQFLGVVALFLIVVGIFSIFSSATGLIINAFDDTELVEEYSERMRYVVALDPLPFEDMNEAPLTTLLFAAMSHAIVSQEDLSEFEYNEIGAIYLPVDVLNVAIDELYGPDIQFNFADFNLNGLDFIYDAEREAYLMPLTSVPTDFVPIAQGMRRSGSTHIVTIGYDIPYDTVIQPVKYNDFVFTRNEDGNYYLSAIRTSELQANVASSSEQTVLDGAAPPTLEQDTAEIFNEALDETMNEPTSEVASEVTSDATTSDIASEATTGEDTSEATTSEATGE